MIAGATDIGLGTGSDFAYVVKGSPEKCVYLVVDKPYSVGVAVTNPAIKVPDDLKGRKVGVTSVGAYTYWFASELPQFLHWPEGVKVTPVSVGGENAGQLAALLTGQIDAVVFDISIGLQLQAQGKGRLLMNAADYVKDVVTTVVWAHNDLQRDHADELKRFLAAMRKSTDYLIDHRDAQVALIAKGTGLSTEIVGPYVDITNPGWSRSGRISPAQLAGTAQALVQSGLLGDVPDLAPLYTAAFDPAS
jgi:ABC-type nitrate/sulfonate/bicarbonate transport system substrate-binding protein